jgi:hypothetical protein
LTKEVHKAEKAVVEVMIDNNQEGDLEVEEKAVIEVMTDHQEGDLEVEEKAVNNNQEGDLEVAEEKEVIEVMIDNNQEGDLEREEVHLVEEDVENRVRPLEEEGVEAVAEIVIWVKSHPSRTY